jgi:hypothetical protein
MTTASPSLDVQAELDRRRRVAVIAIVSMLALTIALSLVAYFARNFFRHQSRPSLDPIVKITILSLGLGSVIVRRISLSANRLKDIAAAKGASGLLTALLTTALTVALLGVTISVLGLVATALTGDSFYTIRAGLVGLVVLFYAYPTRTFWQRALQRFITLGPENQKLSGVQPTD